MSNDQTKPEVHPVYWRFASVLLFFIFLSCGATKLKAQGYLSQPGAPAFTTAQPVEMGFIDVANGDKIYRITSVNKAQPYVNLVNKTTGGNLHVRF